MTEFNLLKRLQSFSDFLKQWIRLNWRILLLPLFGIYLPLLIFVLLAFLILKQQGGLDWDVSLLMAIHASASRTLDAVATTLTDFGTRWGVIPATVALSLGLLYLRRWRSLTYLLITMNGAWFINRLAKALLHRVRPSLWDYPHLHSFSFPSGHAMSSMAFIAALVILTWGSRWCGWILAFGGGFVVAIGWTRLYLGVHYPSDVVAGWMVSIAWAVGVSLVVKPQLTESVEQDEQPVV